MVSILSAATASSCILSQCHGLSHGCSVFPINRSQQYHGNAQTLEKARKNSPLPCNESSQVNRRQSVPAATKTTFWFLLIHRFKSKLSSSPIKIIHVSEKTLLVRQHLLFSVRSKPLRMWFWRNYLFTPHKQPCSHFSAITWLQNQSKVRIWLCTLHFLYYDVDDYYYFGL